jgi:uncharacterized protein YcnI
MSMLKIAGAAALVTLASATASFAHIVADPAEAKPGSYFRTALRVGHGCGAGKPTTAVRVTIPAGIVNASAQPKPGWEIKVETAKLEKPVDAGHGRMTDTVVSAITWSGGSLPNEQFDEFGLVLKLSDTVSQQLALPVVQTCAGGEVRWDQIPAHRTPRRCDPHRQRWQDRTGASSWPCHGAEGRRHQHRAALCARHPRESRRRVPDA